MIDSGMDKLSARGRTDKAHDEKFLALMDRYQHSNDRAFHRALKAIQALQKERLKDEKKFVSRPIPEVLYRGLDKDGNIHTTTANPAPKPEPSVEPPKKRPKRPVSAQISTQAHHVHPNHA